jgi:hypothetical protein
MTYQGIGGTNFHFWVIIFLEIQAMEDRVFDSS